MPEGIFKPSLSHLKTLCIHYQWFNAAVHDRIKGNSSDHTVKFLVHKSRHLAPLPIEKACHSFSGVASGFNI